MARKSRKPVTWTSQAKREYQREFLADVMAGECLSLVLGSLGNTRTVIKDAAGRFVWVSDNVPRHHGLASADEMVGLNDDDINPPRLAKKYRTDDLCVLRSGAPLLGRVELAFDERGMLNWYVTNKIPLRNGTGKIVGLVATIQEYAGIRNLPMFGVELRPIVEFICGHLSEPLNMPKLAALAGVSARQVERRFRNAIGMSPTQFLIRVRLDEACRRLRATNEPLSTIATDLGFYDQCAFTRLFRRHLGVPPGEYRLTRGRQGKPAPAK